MDPLDYYIYVTLCGIFALFFLGKGIRGLSTGRFVTHTRTTAIFVFYNYLWARRKTQAEGEKFYLEHVGPTAKRWSWVYLILGVVLLGIITRLSILQY